MSAPASSNSTIASTVADMLTSTFHQNANTQLIFAGPPQQQHSLSKPDLDKVSLKTALTLLHDHERYIRLNPIVTDCHEIDPTSDEGLRLDVPALLASFANDDASTRGREVRTDTRGGVRGWRYYSITDALPLPLGIPGSSDMTYLAALHDLDDGFESLVLAAGGVTIHGRIMVRDSARKKDGEGGFAVDDGDRTLWLQEQVIVRCWLGMGWYIQKSLGESHEIAHERFRARWEADVRRWVAARGAGVTGLGEASGLVG